MRQLRVDVTLVGILYLLFGKKIFNRDELAALLNFFYRSFYMRPSYVFKRLFKLRSFDDFL